MQYTQVIVGRFIARPNRFIAYVEIDGTVETVHVKNTGRCRELLVPGCRVYLAVSDNPARKTRCDLIAVEKERAGQPPLLINMDSQAPNDIAAEWLPESGLFAPDACFHREVRYGNSRFDFCIEEGERCTYLEVKGVTLERDGEVLFPDAPTERGVKHLQELIACRRMGYGAAVLFVVQMAEARLLRPDDVTHPAFGYALRQAAQADVQLLAVTCRVEPDRVTADSLLPIRL